jgi:heme-degrading monooxygenase HmoA
MTDDALARTPAPPYWAVIFTSRRTDGDRGYEAMADEMAALAAQQPGYLGIESARNAEGVGITVSYWDSEEHVRGWKQVARHLEAQRLGRAEWYRAYEVRVARVERAYGWKKRGE